jgi:hypothetical protein
MEREFTTRILAAAPSIDFGRANMGLLLALGDLFEVRVVNSRSIWLVASKKDPFSRVKGRFAQGALTRLNWRAPLPKIELLGARSTSCPYRCKSRCWRQNAQLVLRAPLVSPRSQRRLIGAVNGFKRSGP